MKLKNILPGFVLPNQDNEMVDIYQLKGDKNLIIYFYPKNESRVCTAESCEFRDFYADFANAGTTIVGINHSTPQELKAFKINHSLPFTLLSDINWGVHKLFDIPILFGIPGRETFLFNKENELVYTFNSFFQGAKHVHVMRSKISM